MISVLDMGDIFESGSQVFVNPINTVGTFGKGLALDFKRKYPKLFEDYWQACRQGHLKVGRIFVWKNPDFPMKKPEYIFNFPTKAHWKDKSKIDYIVSGLNDTASLIKRLKIKSIAMPALGCGLGSLRFEDVLPQIESILGGLDTDVIVYTPR